MNKKSFLLIVAIIALAAASRLMKHPPNFTPIAAISLFGGWYLAKKYFVFIPLLAMFLSDIFIGFYDWRLTAVVYLSIAATFFIGYLLRKKMTWRRVLVGSLSGSIMFFITSNLAVWALYEWYPHTLAGLSSCFVMALPFFKNSLAGDIIYSIVLFGAYQLVWFYASQKQAKFMRV